MVSAKAPAERGLSRTEMYVEGLVRRATQDDAIYDVPYGFFHMSRPRLTIPNALSILRILLVPVFTCFFLKTQYFYALVTVVIAGSTDALDGFIARRFHQRSRLGSWLDPAADKILMLVALLLLSHSGKIPWSFTFLVVGKDAALSIGVGIYNLAGIKLFYKPTYFSKAATASQITVISLSFLEVLLQSGPYVVPAVILVILGPLRTFILYAAYLCTLVAIFQYGYLGYKYWRFGERKS